MYKNSLLINKISTILEPKGFNCEFEKNFPDYDFSSQLFAFKKGKSMKIFPYGDYIFCNFQDFSALKAEEMNSLHQKARKYVNSLYKMPKAFRFAVPNVASVFISSNGFDEDAKQLAMKPTRTMVGGEFNAIYIFDLKNLDFISQGISRTYIPNTPHVTIEFKTVDPQNRMFYLIHAISEWVFKNKAMYMG